MNRFITAPDCIWISMLDLLDWWRDADIFQWQLMYENCACFCGACDTNVYLRLSGQANGWVCCHRRTSKTLQITHASDAFVNIPQNAVFNNDTSLSRWTHLHIYECTYISYDVLKRFYVIVHTTNLNYSFNNGWLVHWGRVMRIYVSKINHHWFR